MIIELTNEEIRLLKKATTALIREENLRIVELNKYKEDEDDELVLFSKNDLKKLNESGIKRIKDELKEETDEIRKLNVKLSKCSLR